MDSSNTSVDTQLTLNRRLGRQSVDRWLHFDRFIWVGCHSADYQPTVDQVWWIVNQVLIRMSIEYGARCQWRVLNESIDEWSAMDAFTYISHSPHFLVFLPYGLLSIGSIYSCLIDGQHVCIFICNHDQTKNKIYPSGPDRSWQKQIFSQDQLLFNMHKPWKWS